MFLIVIITISIVFIIVIFIIEILFVIFILVIFVFYYDGVISDYDWVTIDNMTDHPYIITGLEDGAEYEVQMMAEPLSWGESVFFTASNNGISTDLHQVTSDKQQVQSDEWYTIDGRKLSGKPAAKGIYIQNGQKRIIK